MKTTVTRVFCAYVLVAGILVYPILKMIEAYSLAAGGSLWIEQTCALCSGQYQPEPSINSTDMATATGELALTERRYQFIAKVLSANEKSKACQKARSIIGRYSFSDIQTRACMGKVYHFVATRNGQKFSIKINALTRQIIEVASIPASAAALGPLTELLPEGVNP